MDKDTEFVSTQVLPALTACLGGQSLRELREGSLAFACGGGREHGSSDKLGLEGYQLLGKFGETWQVWPGCQGGGGWG